MKCSFLLRTSRYIYITQGNRLRPSPGRDRSPPWRRASWCPPARRSTAGRGRGRDNDERWPEEIGDAVVHLPVELRILVAHPVPYVEHVAMPMMSERHLIAGAILVPTVREVLTLHTQVLCYTNTHMISALHVQGLQTHARTHARTHAQRMCIRARKRLLPFMVEQVLLSGAERARKFGRETFGSSSQRTRTPTPSQMSSEPPPPPPPPPPRPPGAPARPWNRLHILSLPSFLPSHLSSRVSRPLMAKS